jgi:hypothetical protein
MQRTDVDVTAIVVCRDDEEVVGHTLRRIALHIRSLGLRGEILALDEGSADNTLPLLHLLKRDLPELEVIAGVPSGRGFVRGAELARGRALLVVDGRSDAPLSVLGFALARLSQRRDAVAVGGRYLVLHRTRTLRGHEALAHRRDPRELERRFLRRARSLGLAVDLAVRPRRGAGWASLARLREALRGFRSSGSEPRAAGRGMAPLASRA